MGAHQQRHASRTSPITIRPSDIGSTARPTPSTLTIDLLGTLETTRIDRDRFFVGHKQHLVGNNTDLTWDSHLYGMENRLAAQLQVSSNKITFTQHAGGFPEDTVDVINPDRGFYGVLEPDTATSGSIPWRCRSKTV